VRTGNPDILKAEAKRCGSHYFDRGTMRFFASRLSPQLHPSEKDEDVTYFVTSEKFESSSGSGPRRYSVHRFKNCKIDTVGEFQRFRTGGAAHTAAKRLARGVDSDGLGAFLPTSGLGKLLVFGGLGLAAGATALYFIRRSDGAPAPSGATRKPTPATFGPCGAGKGPNGESYCYFNTKGTTWGFTATQAYENYVAKYGAPPPAPHTTNGAHAMAFEEPAYEVMH
jgi:hypothetical protein